MSAFYIGWYNGLVSTNERTLMSDAHSLQEEIQREVEKLRQEVEEIRHYLERAEPHEAMHPINSGHDTIRLIEQRWEELRQLLEHL